ncbi:MAG: hypothetical protein ABJN26_24220 [Stappiaceae bacterium]
MDSQNKSEVGTQHCPTGVKIAVFLQLSHVLFGLGVWLWSGFTVREALYVLVPVLLIKILIAIGILMGANWARILYLGLTLIEVIDQLSGDTGGFGIAAAVIYAVNVFLLSRLTARAYFSGTERAGARRWDRLAYCVVVIIAVLSVAGSLFRAPLEQWVTETRQWIVKTYKIGYQHHDVASLKLPAGWADGDPSHPLFSGWAAVVGKELLESIALGGFQEENSFEVESGFVFDEGTLLPCGLVPFRLNFPSGTVDPMGRVLVNQAALSTGGANKHHYWTTADIQILEFDVTPLKAYRFVVWHWWRPDDPSHVYGLILGMPESDRNLQDACHVPDIIDSLEIEAPEKPWSASGLNVEQNPAMTPVEMIVIDIDLNRMKSFGIGINDLMRKFQSEADKKIRTSPDELAALPYKLSNGTEIRIGDIARVQYAGRRAPSNAASPHQNAWQPIIVQLGVDCPLNPRDIREMSVPGRGQLTLRIGCSSQL